MFRRSIGLAALALALSTAAASAQTPLKIGLVQSLTGAFNTVGKAAVDGAKLYIQQHGDTVAGRKIQLIVKDDATAPDSKRLAQELIVNDTVAIIGAGITPCALAIAPLATEAKIPTASWCPVPRSRSSARPIWCERALRSGNPRR
jgi:branched-chain amino acid transport system substrate-binding protein